MYACRTLSENLVIDRRMDLYGQSVIEQDPSFLYVDILAGPSSIYLQLLAIQYRYTCIPVDRLYGHAQFCIRVMITNVQGIAFEIVTSISKIRNNETQSYFQLLLLKGIARR